MPFATPRSLDRATTAPWPIRVTVARDPWKIIGWILLRLAIGEIGIIVGLRVPGLFGNAAAIAGLVIVAYAAVLAAVVLSVRVEVMPRELHVVAGPLRIRHRIVPGTVRRWRMAATARHFDTALGSFGIEIGPGRVGDESVDVVRLDPGAVVTYIEAGHTRLAIAVSHEARFLRALEAAGVTVAGQAERDSR